MLSGGRLALGGGALALLSFFFLPYLNVGSVGSLTGWSIASGATRYVPNGASDLSSRMLFMIWLIPLLAAVATILGFMLAARDSYGEVGTARGAGIGVIAGVLLAMTGMLLPVLGVTSLSSLRTSLGIGSSALIQYVGLGYWLTILGLVIALAGGVLALREARDGEAF